MVDPLEGCIAETLEFDIRLGTLLKDVGFELTTLNTGLLVKDAPCLEFLEGTGLLSAFSLSSTLCNIDPSSLRDCEILERQTTVLEIYFASLCLNILLDKQPKVAYSNLLPLSQKKQVILGFKVRPKKQFVLPHLVCACNNQSVPNMAHK